MRPSLLLVDDHENFRRALTIALRIEGFAVIEAESFWEAQALPLPTQLVAVVAHLLAPGDPLSFLDFVSERWPQCKRVVCSLHPESLEAARSHLKGAIEIERPFSAKELLDALGIAPPLIPRRSRA